MENEWILIPEQIFFMKNVFLYWKRFTPSVENVFKAQNSCGKEISTRVDGW